MEQQCVCQTENMTEEDVYNTLHQVIVDYDRQPGNLIQKLHMAQAIFGYFSEPVQHFICKEMDLSVSEVSGVASFYSYFTTQPRGRYNIQVCLGTACYVRPDLLEHERFAMKCLGPVERCRSFGEVSQGFHKLNAIVVAMRCLRYNQRPGWSVSSDEGDRRRTKRIPYIQQLYSQFLGSPCGHLSHELLHTTYTRRSRN